MLKNYKGSLLFFFSSTVVGGAETNILKISTELIARGYKVFWCVLEDNGPLLERVDFDLSGFIEIGLYYKHPIRFCRNYKAFIKEHEIDVVFNFGLRVEIISRIVSKKFGVKAIVSNIRSTDDWRTWRHTQLDIITQKSVDVWVSNSSAGKYAFHQREKIALDKIEVIYNFFETSLEDFAPKNLSNTEVLKIGVLANITKEKGYLDLIPVAKQLDERGIHYQFMYAGKDKLAGKFEQDIHHAGLQDRFEYLGYISDKEAFFKNIDIFLLPSYLEGMPTVVLEALAFGKPVLTTNVGGITEIIDNGKNGLICSPGDINCFVNGIADMKDGNFLLDQFHNKNKLNDFEKEPVMQKWEKLIGKLLSPC